MSKPRVLVVDDDNLMRQMVRDDLAAAGYEVEIAGDGNEALSVIPTFTPDVVVLDVIMPGENGYRVCRAIKEQASEGTGAVPRVVLLTGRRVDDEADREQVLLGFSHADAMLYKPCEPAHLRDAIAKLLANTSPVR